MSKSIESHNTQENFSRLVIVCNTWTGLDEVSQNRKPLTLELLQRTHELGVMVLIVDGGSQDQDFIQQVQTFSNVEFIPGVDETGKRKFNSYGEQVRATYSEALSRFPDTDMKFLRVEPEKYGLITQETLEKVINSSDENPQASFIGLMRQSYANMCMHRLLSENRAARQINAELETDISKFIIGDEEQAVLPGVHLRKYGTDVRDYNEAEITGNSNTRFVEGPGTFFGPFMVTREGAEKIINYQPEEGADSYESFYIPRFEEFMDSYRSQVKKVLFLPVNHTYDQEKEINPENKDAQKLLSYRSGVKQIRNLLIDFLLKNEPFEELKQKITILLNILKLGEQFDTLIDNKLDSFLERKNFTDSYRDGTISKQFIYQNFQVGVEDFRHIDPTNLALKRIQQYQAIVPAMKKVIEQKKKSQ